MQTEPPSRELDAHKALFLALTIWSIVGAQVIVFIRVWEAVGIKLLHRGIAYLHLFPPMLGARVEKGVKPSWCCNVEFGGILFEVYLERYACLVTLYVNKEAEVEWIVVAPCHGAIDGRSIMALFCYLDVFLVDGFCPEPASLSLPKPVEELLRAVGHVSSDTLFYRSRKEVMWPPVEQLAAVEKRTSHAISRAPPTEVNECLAAFGERHHINHTAIYCAIAVISDHTLPSHRPWVEILLPMRVRRMYQPIIDIHVVGGRVPPQPLRKFLLSLFQGIL
ncbi:hypothetical protein ACJJIG_01620 [Microbulbifer sp. SSSA007]|uniref:hypothetical protein n=1 Tax=Microbulbifer sp. SSSA007 TaxID=3243379 RepID=UPI00403A7295